MRFGFTLKLWPPPLLLCNEKSTLKIKNIYNLSKSLYFYLPLSYSVSLFHALFPCLFLTTLHYTGASQYIRMMWKS